MKTVPSVTFPIQCGGLNERMTATDEQNENPLLRQREDGDGLDFRLLWSASGET